jgi:hypothetical protein
MIRRSPYVPQEVKQNLKARGNTIVGAETIKKPPGTISEWPVNFAAAFRSGHWEITTAQEHFTPIKDGSEFLIQRRIFFNLQRGEFEPGRWNKTSPYSNEQEWSPQMESQVKKLKLNEGPKDGDWITFGETFSSEEVNKHVKKGETGFIVRLKSQRALIIIVNEVTVIGVHPSKFFISLFLGISEFSVASRQFPVPEDKIVEVFLHEIAAHAGLMSQGLPSLHGTSSIVKEHDETIQELFPKDTTNRKVTTAVVEAEGRLRDLSLRSSTKGRTPGPLRSDKRA